MYKLIKLSTEWREDAYISSQGIAENENEFKNTAYGLTKTEFLEWLRVQEAWSREQMLPAGYVGQTIYWFEHEGVIVGYGKIRHQLNDSSRECGGNIGYAIDNRNRGKGFGAIFLAMLIEKAKEKPVEEILLTVEKYNPASKKVIEKCGGKMIKENSERWFFTF